MTMAHRFFFILVFATLLFAGLESILGSAFLLSPSRQQQQEALDISSSSSWRSFGHLRRKLFTDIPSSSSSSSWQSFGHLKRKKLFHGVPCTGVLKHKGYKDECSFVKNTEACRSQGFLSYNEFFYCTCQKSRGLGYVALLSWLLVLFYLLGNTSANYFCCTLQRLSSLMSLSPAVSGVTLLALGNGAPDVFSSVAAFMSSGAQGSSLGLSSILGGCAFVTMLVSGSVTLVAATGGPRVKLELPSLWRDVGFLVLAIVCLSVIISDGQIFLHEVLCFLFLYVAYTASIAVMELFCCNNNNNNNRAKGEAGLLSVHHNNKLPLLLPEEPIQYSWNNDGYNKSPMVIVRYYLGLFYAYIIQFPLTLPLRLTIPIVKEERWHRPSAVISMCLAPSLIALVWMGNFKTSQWIIIPIPLLVGACLGVLAYFATESDKPPQYFNFAWVATGFVMSVIWFYLTSQELLEVLVAMGTIFDINPSILALTMLAWGNSIGDLISNICMAFDGEFGIKAAMSGCFAGPIFNIVVGLGICLLFASWKSHPSPFILPDTFGTNITIIFLLLGLVWTMIIIPSMNMQLSKTSGIVLLCLYGCFIVTRVSQDLGWI